MNIFMTCINIYFLICILTLRRDAMDPQYHQIHREILSAASCVQGMKDKKYYGKSCLYGNCSRCNGFAILNHCIHGSDEHQFGNMSVEMQSFKYITYQSDSAKESKNIALVKSHV